MSKLAAPSAPPARSPASDPASSEPSPLQSIGSVLLFAHLFFVGTALAANQAPSALQERLLSVFRPYVRLFNFDVTYIPYHLTHASVADAEHRIEYLPAGGDPGSADDWVRLQEGPRGSERRARYQRLASLLAMVGGSEDGAVAAEISAAIGTGVSRQQGSTIAQLRSRRQLLQSPDDVAGANLDRRNPDDPSYFQEVYRVQVLDLGGQMLGVQKVESLGQVAPSVSGKKPASGQNRRP